MTMAFQQGEKELDQVLHGKFHDKQALNLFVLVLGRKICGSSGMDSVRNSLVSKICNQDFLKELQDLTFALAADTTEYV